MSTAPTRRQQLRDATRVAILDAARDLIVAEGIANLTMRKLAERLQ